jgi:hypothetical protein
MDSLLYVETTVSTSNAGRHPAQQQCDEILSATRQREREQIRDDLNNREAIAAAHDYHAIRASDVEEFISADAERADLRFWQGRLATSSRRRLVAARMRRCRQSVAMPKQVFDAVDLIREQREHEKAAPLTVSPVQHDGGQISNPLRRWPSCQGIAPRA